jgi:hypothetical protein
MIQNTGRSAHKYFMRHKPIPEGYKFFILAEGGYVYNFYPETPVLKARLPLEPRPHQPQYVFSRTSEIVLHLLRSLPFSNSYFEIAMDNYFTNPLLFQYLRDELHMGAYGTLRGSCSFGSKNEPCPLDNISASTPLPYLSLFDRVRSSRERIRRPMDGQCTGEITHHYAYCCW